LNARNLIASESPDFSYYVDHEGNKQGVGWITVAKLENPFSSEKEFRDKILDKLNIYRMSAWSDDNLIIDSFWDYKWSDPNYVQNEIEHLRQFFPR
jgi:archaellum biogenesis ATPase FlaH